MRWSSFPGDPPHKTCGDGGQTPLLDDGPCDHNYFSVSRVDMDRGKTYTIDTIRIRAIYGPEVGFSSSADAILEILTWKSPEASHLRVRCCKSPGHSLTDQGSVGGLYTIIRTEPSVAVPPWHSPLMCGSPMDVLSVPITCGGLLYAKTRLYREHNSGRAALQPRICKRIEEFK